MIAERTDASDAAAMPDPRPVDDPRPGFFKLRIVKGGPFVGAELRYGPARDPETGGIMSERSYQWETWIGGKMVADPSPDPVKAGVFRVWLSGTEILEAEYRYLIADREWCARHAPEKPEANPTRAVKVADLPPSHFLPE